MPLLHGFSLCLARTSQTPARWIPHPFKPMLSKACKPQLTVPQFHSSVSSTDHFPAHSNIYLCDLFPACHPPIQSKCHRDNKPVWLTDVSINTQALTKMYAGSIYVHRVPLKSRTGTERWLLEGATWEVTDMVIRGLPRVRYRCDRRKEISVRHIKEI